MKTTAEIRELIDNTKITADAAAICRILDILSAINERLATAERHQGIEAMIRLAPSFTDGETLLKTPQGEVKWIKAKP